MISIPRLRFDPAAPLTDRLFLRLCGAESRTAAQHSATGELIIMSPAGSGYRRSQPEDRPGQLANWVDSSGLGRGFDSSAGFTLPNGAIRSPDASWIERDRWDALTDDEQEGFAPICPDFVVGPPISHRPTRRGPREDARVSQPGGTARLADRPEAEGRGGLPPPVAGSRS